MNVRRSAAAAALTAALCLTGVPLAHAADSPSPSAPGPLPSGLYGKKDPTYDGVFRQSYALLAQHTVGVEPAQKAVDWLTGQQCDSGGFAPFRADPSEPCDGKTPVDSNSTAAAVQALAALGGQNATVKKGVDWLKSVQNQDGGWGYNPGLPSDANSTGIVIGALVAAGEKPDAVTSQKDKSAYDALTGLTIPCADKDGGAFGLADLKTKKLAANADASAAGVLGALGKGLVVKEGSGAKDTEPGKCAGPKSAEQAAANGATYLQDVLAKNDDHLKSATPGAAEQADYGNTADATVALAAAGRTEQAKKSAAWLAQDEGTVKWAKQNGPAAYAQLIFAAHATGADPKDFGGTDLVSALNATGPEPAKADTSDAQESSDDAGPGGGISVWWMVGVFFVASVGIGFLLSGRNKKNQL
ncbi:prenyltransferase/squalene oxidase repeat-containing protein [Streptomyces sp. NPDC002851]